MRLDTGRGECGTLSYSLEGNRICCRPEGHEGEHEFVSHLCAACGVSHGTCSACGCTHGDSHERGCRALELREVEQGGERKVAGRERVLQERLTRAQAEIQRLAGQLDQLRKERADEWRAVREATSIIEDYQRLRGMQSECDTLLRSAGVPAPGTVDHRLRVLIARSGSVEQSVVSQWLLYGQNVCAALREEMTSLEQREQRAEEALASLRDRSERREQAPGAVVELLVLESLLASLPANALEERRTLLGSIELARDRLTDEEASWLDARAAGARRFWPW